jgi:hypothetical protein
MFGDFNGCRLVQLLPLGLHRKFFAAHTSETTTSAPPIQRGRLVWAAKML